MQWVQNRTARWSVGTVVVCLLLVTAAWFFLLAPRRAQVAELRAQEVAQRETNEALRVRVRELQAQFAKLPETRAKLAQVRQQLPSGAEVPAFVRSVNGLATSSGVELVGITPSEAENVSGARGTARGGGPSDLVAIPMSLTVSGDYFQVVAFVRQLQTSLPRAVLITGLQLEQADENQQSARVKAVISGKIFTLSETSTAKSAAPSSGASGSSAGPSSGSAGSSAGPSSGASGSSAGPSSGSAGSSAGSSSGSSGSTVALGGPEHDAGSRRVPW